MLTLLRRAPLFCIIFGFSFCFFFLCVRYLAWSIQRTRASYRSFAILFSPLSLFRFSHSFVLLSFLSLCLLILLSARSLISDWVSAAFESRQTSILSFIFLTIFIRFDDAGPSVVKKHMPFSHVAHIPTGLATRFTASFFIFLTYHFLLFSLLFRCFFLFHVFHLLLHSVVWATDRCHKNDTSFNLECM